MENNGFKEKVLVHMGTMNEAVNTIKSSIKDMKVSQEKFHQEVDEQIEDMHVWRARMVGIAIAVSGIATIAIQVAIRWLF